MSDQIDLSRLEKKFIIRNVAVLHELIVAIRFKATLAEAINSAAFR